MSESMPTAPSPASGPSASASATPSAPSKVTPSTAPSSPAKPTSAPSTTPTQTAPTNVSTPSEPKVYNFKYKVDGVEKVFKGTEEQLQVMLQKGEASDARFRKAKELEKKFMELTTYAQQDSARARQAYKELFGRDFDQDAEAHLASKYEESTLSEEEKAHRKELQEAKEAKEKLKQYETKAQAEARKKQEDALWAEMQKTYFSALDKLGYDKDPAILTLMADIDEAATSMGVELSDAQLVSEANRRLEQNARHVFKRFTKPGQGPQLLEFLGADGVKAVIMAEMERRKMASPTPQTAPAPNPRSPVDEVIKTRDEATKRRLNAKEEFRRMKYGLD